MKRDRQFLWLRLQSLSGVVPVGLFVLLHLYTNSFSLKGAGAYDARLRRLDELPLMTPFEILFIYLPILFHAILGLVITFRGQVNLLAYPRLGNWRYVLQRLSGIGVLLFVGAHVYKTRVEPALRGFTLDFAHMQEAMSEPLTFTVYLLGMLGTAYHLANGLWTFSITWGIAANRRAQSRLTAVAIVLFVLIFLMGVNNMAGFLGRGVAF
jgi:succinate dehydrogenase / fumarate reductase cytochrome b subunit